MRAASQKICVQLPKDPKISPKRIPENHPRDPCAPPQNPRISPEGSVSIPQRIPEYFPKRSMTSAAEGRAGPGFPAGSGRSPPSSAAGIPHPLRTPGPGQRRHPAPWGGNGEGASSPAAPCRGPESLGGFQDHTKLGSRDQTGSPRTGGRPLLDEGDPGIPPAAPTHLLLLQIRSRSFPGVSAGIFHSQAARNPQTLRTSQPRNLEGTHGDILAGGGLFHQDQSPPNCLFARIQDIFPHFTAGNFEALVN